jgi:hypothetical protein
MSHLDPSLNIDTFETIAAADVFDETNEVGFVLVLVGSTWKKVSLADLLTAITATTDELYEPVA